MCDKKTPKLGPSFPYTYNWVQHDPINGATRPPGTIRVTRRWSHSIAAFIFQKIHTSVVVLCTTLLTVTSLLDLLYAYEVMTVVIIIHPVSGWSKQTNKWRLVVFMYVRSTDWVAWRTVTEKSLSILNSEDVNPHPYEFRLGSVNLPSFIEWNGLCIHAYMYSNIEFEYSNRGPKIHYPYLCMTHKKL